MPESKWGPDVDGRTKEAGRRLRTFVDAWVARYGDKGFLPRIGNIPSLAVKDLALILTEWEGPHEWAVCEWRTYCDEGDGGESVAGALKTFLYEEEARSALPYFVAGAFVARWDDNGPGSCWLPC